MIEVRVIILKNVLNLVRVGIPLFSSRVKMEGYLVKKCRSEVRSIEEILLFEVKVPFDEPVLSSHQGVEIIKYSLRRSNEFLDVVIDEVVETVENQENDQDRNPLVVLRISDQPDLGN